LYEKWMRWKKYRNEIKAKSCGILFLLSSLLWSLFFFFLVGLGFDQVLDCLSYTSSPFCSSYFRDGGLRNYLLGCSQTMILPISTS
jgi:hypothetical protein